MIQIISLFSAFILFTQDSGSEVEILFETTTNGRRKNSFARIAAYSVISLITVIVNMTVYYVCNYITFGLPGINYPIQSIQYFSEYQGKLSLLGTYLEMGILSFAGLLVAGLTIYIVASIFKNRYLSVLIGIFVFFGPYIISVDIIPYTYRLPINCFNSNLSIYNNKQYIIAALAFVVILAFIISLYISKKENNRRIAKSEK